MGLKKILIVEDESIVAFDIEMQLRSRGYDIVATTGYAEEVPGFLQNETIDLILMDIRLKGRISGLDMAKKILESTEIPVIFLTALSDYDTQNTIKNLNSAKYIKKPFYTETLFETIEEVFSIFHQS